MSSSPQQEKTRWHMPVRSLVLACTLACPLSAWAAEPNGLRVTSGLGQPFRAEIELTGVGAEQAQVSLASEAAYKKQRVKYPEYAAGMQVYVEKRADGRIFARLLSPQPVNVPAVALVVNVKSRGRQVTHTLHAPISRKGRASASEAKLSDTKKSDKKSDKKNDIKSSGSYHVRSGDTLSSLAGRVKPRGVTLEQAMLGIYRANPQAFEGHNMNALTNGAVLTIPSAAKMKSVSAAEAGRQVWAQVANWRAYRGRLANVASQQPARKAVDSTQGRIEEQTPPAVVPEFEGSRDVLRLSKADKKALANVQQRAQILEEELIARDKSLEEANERIQELEKNIAEMQALLALKNNVAAEQSADDASASTDENGEPLWPWLAGGMGLAALTSGGLWWWRRRKDAQAAAELSPAVVPPEPEPTPEPESEPTSESVVEPEPTPPVSDDPLPFAAVDFETIEVPELPFEKRDKEQSFGDESELPMSFGDETVFDGGGYSEPDHSTSNEMDLMMLDGLLSPPEESAPPAPPPPPPKPAPPPEPEPEVDDNPILDFDFELEDILPEENAQTQPADTSADEGLTRTTPESAAEQQQDVDSGDPVATKLELARVYIEMGDSEGAKEILQEVLEEGNEARQQEAQALMATL